MSDDSVSVADLAMWLIDRGMAEERRGYGHVSGEDLAEALLAEFAVTPRHSLGKL